MGEKNELSVAGRYENIRKVCDFVADGAKASGLPDSAVFHIELACDEACTNVIEHAYQGENKGEIVVSWETTPQQFVVEVCDNGRPFEPTTVPAPPDKPDGVEELKIGGLGLHFMKKLMDDISFRFENNGNILTMKKNR